MWKTAGIVSACKEFGFAFEVLPFVFIITNKFTVNVAKVYNTKVSLYNLYCYTFQHFHIVIRQFHICALPSYINC